MMPVFLKANDTSFPSPERADLDGLLALGGDLRPERLLSAYRQGIFPWYSEGEPILWWCPDPRFVLFPEELKYNRTSRQLQRNNPFTCTVNQAFPAVIHHCRHVYRPGQAGTWITDAVEKAYTRLHELGFAHSVEVWEEGQLVGGLYGVLLGKVFFGESMFSHASNASRAGFLFWVEKLKQQGVCLIDCQVYTGYLESFGARMIPRNLFLELIGKSVDG